MDEKHKKAVEEYQCSGCVNGSDITCFLINQAAGIGCGKHHAGTFGMGTGSFFLGLPKGFNRLGEHAKMKPAIFERFEDVQKEWEYDMWNIPVWKYLNENGHTLVRGLMPRRNEPFLHIILEDCRDKINCREITQEEIDGMD